MGLSIMWKLRFLYNGVLKLLSLSYPNFWLFSLYIFLSSQALIPPFQTLMEGTFATMWKASHRQGKGHQEGSDARVLSSGPTQAQPIGVFYNLWS